MKLNILHIVLFVFVPFFSKAQSWETDTRYIKHWEGKINSCEYFFNNEEFVGFLLDGNKLKEADILLSMKIKGRVGIDIDTSYAFSTVKMDTAIVYEFEKILKDTLIKNESILLSDPPYLSEQFYFRQYIEFQHNSSNYLLVSFQLDVDNLLLKEERYYFKDRQERSYKRHLLIDTRNFVSPALDQWKRVNDPFYVLYNIDKKMMNFFFVGER